MTRNRATAKKAGTAAGSGPPEQGDLLELLGVNG